MPDAVGHDYVEAAAEAFAEGVIADTYPVRSDEVRGTVVAQEPAAGAAVERGSIVRLNVSLGQGELAKRDVPDMTGMKLAAAHQVCHEAGFTCRTVYGRGQARIVVEQKPAFGKVVDELTQMTLVVGR